MKIPPFSVALPSLAAASLLSLGLFQACQHTPAVGSAMVPPGGPDPLVWFEAEPVEIQTGRTNKEKKDALKKALKLGKKSKTRFCFQEGSNPRKCDPVPHNAPVASILKGIHTDAVVNLDHLEAGGGTDALHVAQQVEFAQVGQKEAFNKALGY